MNQHLKRSTQWLFAFAFIAAAAPRLPAAPTALAGDAVRPGFWLLHWFEGEEGKRFRVNAPEAVLHPKFGRRSEVRSNGMMLLNAPVDLSSVGDVEFYLEMWGGHPGSANKRVTFNGRSCYPLPDPGTGARYCTYSYPTVRPTRTDLVSGTNAIQFSVDKGSTFWGHFIIDNACLRFHLAGDHAVVGEMGLAGFSAEVTADSRPVEHETIICTLDVPAQWAARVERVDFQARYRGYDENGDGNESDWHGFTKDREPQAIIGSRDRAPWSVPWNTSMIPAQSDVAVRAVVQFRNAPGLIYVTPEAPTPAIAHPAGTEVVLERPDTVPTEFWSRADKVKSCSIFLREGRIARAVLHVTAWTGGAGEVRDYFTLNGHPFAAAEGDGHELVYGSFEVPPGVLRAGENTVLLRSDTHEHGIEIPLPGPCLMVRYEVR